jgi:superfamily I DNA/RNA helicase
MPWVPDLNLLDSDQRDFVDGPLLKQNVFIKGFAGTGKSVLLVAKLHAIYEINPEAICCVVSFAHSLLEAFRLGLKEIGLDKRIADRNGNNECIAKKGQIDLVTKYEFKKNQKSNLLINYDFIFFDEVQDLCVSDLQILNQSKAEFKCIAGDANQSIYSNDPQKDINTNTKESTLNLVDIRNFFTPQEVLLTYGHRLTPSVLACVFNLIPNLKEKLLNEFTVSHNRDVDVLLAHAGDEEDEIAYVYEQALNLAEDVELTAILLPMHSWIFSFCRSLFGHLNVPWNQELENWFGSRNYSKINDYFKDNGIKIEYVGNEHGSFIHARENNNIILMTYHSSKGMDFQNVFLPFLSSARYTDKLDNFIPTPLMVAMTRSNYNLTISYSGDPLHCISNFKDLSECFYQIIESKEDNSSDSFVLPF